MLQKHKITPFCHDLVHMHIHAKMLFQIYCQRKKIIFWIPASRVISTTLHTVWTGGVGVQEQDPALSGLSLLVQDPAPASPVLWSTVCVLWGISKLVNIDG